MTRMLLIFHTMSGIAAAGAIAFLPQPGVALDDLDPGFTLERGPSAPIPEPLNEEYCRRERLNTHHDYKFTDGYPPAPPYKHPFPIVVVLPPQQYVSGKIFRGSAALEFTVRSDGRTEDVRAVKSSHEIFEKPAIRAMEQFRWCPVFVEGEPVETKGVKTRIDFMVEGADCNGGGVHR